MSGICGWSNNQLALENRSNILEKMLAELAINPNHVTVQADFGYCVVAAAGNPSTGSICQEDGIIAAVQGNPQWPDLALARTAQERGAAYTALLAYRKQGIAFLSHLSGSFVLSIVDAAKQETLIAIDKLGINSLFFTEQSGQLIFSSNARSIRLHPSADKGVSPQGIFDYLYFHMVPSPHCVFNAVEKLLPGQYLLFDGKQLKKDFYWQPSYLKCSTTSQNRLEEEFLAILESSIGRAINDPNTGAFLSGGTDSSTIAGIFRKLKGSPVDTYSIGFNAAGFDEMEFARIATKHFGNTAHEYYLTPQDVVDAIPLIAKAYDEPFGNASAVPAYYCAKLAQADGIGTLLAGDGGDELFAGNERYAKQRVFECYHHIPKTFRKSLIEPAIFGLPMADNMWPVKKAQSYIKQANIPLPDRLESYNFLNRMPLADIFEADFLRSVNTGEPLNYLRNTYHQAAAESSLNRMLFVDLKFTLADNDLRKVNRMCELGGVDVRYPLLDDELLRFSTELPVHLKLKGLKLRYFFKHALRKLLPKEILEKNKHGFGLPFGLWMNTYDPLREMANENLIALSRRGIIKPDFVSRLQQLHKEYPSYYGVMIWVLMMLEQWLQSTQ